MVNRSPMNGLANDNSSDFEAVGKPTAAVFLNSDVSQYGPYAAEMLRKTARDVALSSSIETKLMAFREGASTLGQAVSDQWLPRNVAVDRLVQIASAHNGFGAGDDQIERIIAEAMARADQKFKTAHSTSTAGRATRTEWSLVDALPAATTDADLSAPFVKTEPNIAAESLAWPAALPIKSMLPPVEKFIPDLLPDAIRDYVLDVADRQQAPPDFAAVTALCGLAAVVGNRVRVRPKQNDDWEVVPNLWGAIIGRPSAMKSPAMRAALGPIYAIEDDLRRKWEEDTKTAQIDDALSSLDAKDAKKKAETALKGGDREGARGILATLVDGDDEPPCPRIVVNDTTVEKLGELLNENPRGLLLIRDELPGFLARLESEEHQSERAFYLESFNGDGRFTYDRIGRGTVHIDNCTVSIIGGVQPSRIAPIVRGAMAGTSNDGLIQRLQMTVWPDDAGPWRWVDRKPNQAARLAYDKVFRDLYELSMGGTGTPAILCLSPQSQVLFQQWMMEMQTEARSNSFSSALESHILKMPKTVVSLALLFELADGGRCEVNEVAMRRALSAKPRQPAVLRRRNYGGKRCTDDHRAPPPTAQPVHPAGCSAQGLGFVERSGRGGVCHRHSGQHSSLPRGSTGGSSSRWPSFGLIYLEPEIEGGGLILMGKWLNQLREIAKTPGDRTDKTDKTGPAKVLSPYQGKA